MARQELAITVFISSTGEMAMEREICLEVIEELNNIRGSREQFVVRPLTWESTVTSDFGKSPQEIINDQIGDDYDIFIGFLCSRFGTPTAEYESGTQEEFERALLRKHENPDSVGISFFFKDPKASELSINARELLRIEEFREGISDNGLYKGYKELSEFRTEVTASLSRHIDRILEHQKSSQTSMEQSRSTVTIPRTTSLVVTDEYDPDMGIMELSEATEELLATITSRWVEMGSATERLGEKVSSRVDELSAVPADASGTKDRRKVKPILNRIAAEMDRHSSILERENQSAEKEASDFFRLTQRTVLMSAEDGLATNNEIEALRQTYQEMHLTVIQTSTQIGGLKEAVVGVPRLTSRINQARRRSEKAINGVIRSLAAFEAGISTVLDSLSQEMAKRSK